MRFRFCGDLDCPDWALAEIATLTRITSIKMKLLSLQVIKGLLNQGMDYDKIYQLTADAKFESGDVKACIAALNLIITSAAKHGVDEESLLAEIQQLGLPKEHSVALCKLYAEYFEALQKSLVDKTLSLSRLEEFRWRVDYVVSSSQLKNADAPLAHLHLKTSSTNEERTSYGFAIAPNKLQVLLNEMKHLRSQMETLT